MTAITLPNSGLQAGYISGESGWGPAMNRNMRVLDALVQPRVIDKDLGTPPGSPSTGAAYIIGASASGAWAGRTGQIALWITGDDITSAWAFVSPKSGWRMYVVDEATDYMFNGSGWVVQTYSGGGEGGGSTPVQRNVVSDLSRDGAGSVLIDVADTDYFKLQLTGNISGFTFAGLPGAGKAMTLMVHITQDSVARTVAWPSSFKWVGTPPFVSNTPGTIDLLALTSFDNGATWLCTLAKGWA